MAMFNATGIEGLELSFKEFAEIPDDVVENMLTAAGEVIVDAHKASIRKLGLVDTGALARSIKYHSKVGYRGGERKRYVLVYPTGNHGQRNRKAITKVYKRSKHGTTYTVGGDTVKVTNSEVGFIHEYGAPRRGIPASQWMRKANENAADAMVEAELRVYSEWLRKIGF